jgi:hypothetical protein
MLAALAAMAGVRCGKIDRDLEPHRAAQAGALVHDRVSATSPDPAATGAGILPQATAGESDPDGRHDFVARRGRFVAAGPARRRIA